MTSLRGALGSIGLAVVLSASVAPAIAHAETPPPAAASAKVSARGLFDRGRTLYEDAQYEESIQTLSAAMLRPDSSVDDKKAVYQYLAYDYIALGRKDEAEAAVRALFVLDPDFSLPATESPRLREFFVNAKARWEAEGRPGIVEDVVPPAPIVLRHSAPAQVDGDKTFAVRGSLSDPDKRVTRMRLYVRAGTKGRFESRPATVIGGSFSANVPAIFVKAPLVEYYFEAFDASGLPIASRGDAGGPLRIAVKEKPKRSWIAPVAIGSGVLGAAAIVGVMALAGVFSSSASSNPTPTPSSTVTILVPE